MDPNRPNVNIVNVQPKLTGVLALSLITGIAIGIAYLIGENREKQRIEESYDLTPKPVN